MFHFPKTNLFCNKWRSYVWRDSGVILSNQMSVFMQLATTWSDARQIWTWVVERATLLFNSFCRNVAKQVASFCCPFYRRFSVLNLLLHVNIIRRNDTLRIRLTRYGDKWLHIKTRFWQIWHSTFSNTTTLKKTIDISKHQQHKSEEKLNTAKSKQMIIGHWTFGHTELIPMMCLRDHQK